MDVIISDVAYIILDKIGSCFVVLDCLELKLENIFKSFCREHL